MGVGEARSRGACRPAAKDGKLSHGRACTSHVGCNRKQEGESRSNKAQNRACNQERGNMNVEAHKVSNQGQDC
eukprot:1097702-Pleurochrysis_carterae.AAC.4